MDKKRRGNGRRCTKMDRRIEASSSYRGPERRILGDRRSGIDRRAKK
jgi:hypothetical protein